jgi:two-component system NtrC family response regulator
MSAADQIVHPTLEPGPAALAMGMARLTDRQRIAALLQGAALLSLLERAAWWLPRGWHGAGVSAGGRLLLPAGAASPGRSPRPAQEQLKELLLRLFGAAAGDAGANTADGPGAAAAADPGVAAAWSSGPGWEGAAAGSSLVAGRGEARRAARTLLGEWWQTLVPVPADEAVAEILAAAPFLWHPAFAAARQSLAGELRGDAETCLWVAGPSASRARLLAGGAGAVELAGRLGGAAARSWWEGAGETGSATAAARRPMPQRWRWREVLSAARSHAPATDAARIELATALAGLGRSAAALAALAPCRSPAARLLRARCLLRLGRLGAARAALRRLEPLPLPPDEAIEAAEVAVRVFANSGEPEPVRRWVERALAAGRSAPGAERARAHLVAAVAAWDRQEPAAMDPYLAAASAALCDDAAAATGGDGGLVPGDPQVLWRWHHARALRAMAVADGAAVVEHLGRALARGRRVLSHHEAAGLWNDLGIGRVQTGDLAGAERAFLHALRLFGGCDGPRRTTLALHNLAEVRLRRGRIAGVREILARSAAEDRRGGNLRGLTQDAEVWARLELLVGRPEQAAALCRSALARLDRRRSGWRREVLRVLLARALGWLEQPSEAAGELAHATPEAVAELEPEERPALWAHAGDRAAARRAAALLAAPSGALWQAVLAGEPAPAELWEALAGLEPYRAARLVFDVERAGAGGQLAPAAWRRQAIVTLRHLGASGMAGWLEAREAGPWQALAAYAARPAGDLQAIAELLRRAADPGARLSWIPAGEVEVRETSEEELASTGGALLAADLPAGRLELRGRRLDPALASCFALAVRDLAAGGGRSAPSAAALGHDGQGEPGGPTRAARAAGSGAADPAGAAGAPAASPAAAMAAAGLIGSSPRLRATLQRLARVATVDMPVLIRGESGTGKELAARAIHGASSRAHGPFVAVNCAALAESLLLSDLFGHVRGAYTGADRDRIGVFETARGGTVLLDEIGDLPLAAQGLLLRVLQEGEVRRLGESLPRRVDVRVLAATHRDLERGVAKGTFREDLFYRLKVGAVDLPPLRDRGDDVLELADFFLSRRSPPPRLGPAARERLRRHAWPGNVRELENVLRLAAALAGGGIIQPEHLEMPAVEPAAAPAGGSYHQQVEDLRRRLVRDAIDTAAGNHAEAARRLGISRQALSYLVRQLGLR